MFQSIGIIGFGRFGGLMARYLSEDVTVFVYDRREPSPELDQTHVRLASFETVCAQDVVIPAVPISALESVLRQMAPVIRADALVVDVCSVKMRPVEWMRRTLPSSVSFLATHPMFGPDSAAASLSGCKIVLCPGRIPAARLRRIVGYLEGKGLEVIQTTSEEHDRQIAVTLGMTHFIGRSLAQFGVEKLPIDTEGYKRLMHILGVVENDTWQLFMDMHRYNPYARASRTAFMEALKKIDAKITAGGGV